VFESMNRIFDHDHSYCNLHTYKAVMEGTVQVHIEKLPEGLYLATSEDVQGLVAQGRTVAETLEIARDVVRKLLEAQQGNISLKELGDDFDYPLVVGL
jgi:predicted RNase H-like HicB family nuclease